LAYDVHDAAHRWVSLGQVAHSQRRIARTATKHRSDIRSQMEYLAVKRDADLRFD
jgi:hypothetical protein